MDNQRGGMALSSIIKLILLLGCGIGGVQPAWGDADIFLEPVIVVTSNQRPVSTMQMDSTTAGGLKPEFQILNLDSVENIEQRLSDGLPIDPDQARAMVNERIARIGRARLESDIRAVYLPLGTLMANDLDRFPAIIFERKAVVFGVTDLDKAIKLYLNWVKDQQGGTVNE
jgi:integrating conjugative element protein (TIGR03757 family)